MNSNLKKFGTPHNVSDCTGGNKTLAESMPAIDSGIAGNKVFGKPTATYGVDGVGDAKGSGGKKSSTGEY